MMDICKNAGFSIQQRKVVRPCEIIEFLGIELDSVKMTSRITEKRLSDIMNELAKFTDKKIMYKTRVTFSDWQINFCHESNPSRSYIHKETDRVIKEGEILALSNNTKQMRASRYWVVDVVPTNLEWTLHVPG